MSREYFTLDSQPDIDGLRFRMYSGSSDHEDMYNISQKQDRFHDFDFHETFEDFETIYRNLKNCDPFKDIIIAELDGAHIGYIRVNWSRKVEGGYNYNLMSSFDPDHYGTGIREAMIHWAEERLREIAKGHPDTETKEFQTWSMSDDDVWINLLESGGYRKVRYGYIMTRPLVGVELPRRPLPEGLEVRPVTEEDYRKVWEADVEASKDGWQMVELSEENYRIWMEHQEFQPEKWQIAFDKETGEVAGAVQNFIHTEENGLYGRLRGYTENIHVGRKWRGRGVAKALIASSFKLLKELGMEEACLGVDAENPTGALRLYESMGFEVDKTFLTFRKKL